MRLAAKLCLTIPALLAPTLAWAQAAAAIKQVRAMGPAGLEALLALQPGSESADVTMISKWQAAVDAVASQHEASRSRLYWFTDFDQAKKAAQSTGKPIISLRLLGKLTDEYSCANSRFFRQSPQIRPPMWKRLPAWISG